MSRLKMTPEGKTKAVYNTHRELSVDESEKDTSGHVTNSLEKSTSYQELEEPFIDPEFKKIWEKK